MEDYEDNVDFQVAYKNLRKTLRDFEDELDKRDQQIYDLKRQLSTATELENDYMQEIQMLESKETTRITKLEEKVAYLDQEILKNRQNYLEQLQSLTDEIALKDAKIVQMQSNLDLISESGSDGKLSEINDITAENIALSNKVGILLEDVEKLQNDIDTLQKQNLLYEGTINQLTSEIVSVKESVNCKKEELHEAKELNQTLQDDLFVTKNELESLRSKPLDQDTKGNSLFAEVDDKRVELQKRIISMRQKYTSMKRDYVLKTTEVTRLRVEVAKLCRNLEEVAKEKAEDEERILSSNKLRIRNLEILVEKYEQEIKERQVLSSKDLSGNELQFIQNMIDSKRKENEKLMVEFRKDSLVQMTQAKLLQESNASKQYWKSVALQLENEVCQLKDTIQNIKHDSPLEASLPVEYPSKDQRKMENCSTAVQKSRLKEAEVFCDPKSTRKNLSSKVDIKEEIRTSNVACRKRSENKSMDFVCKLEVVDDICTNVNIKEEKIDSDDKENVSNNVKIEKCDSLEIENANSQIKHSERRVQFTEDTQDSKSTSSRKGGKKLECKMMYIPSKPIPKRNE